MPKTKVLRVDSNLPDEKDLELASNMLKDGKLVVFPTETVYGIGANYHNKEAVKKLYQIKKRPLSKPFTVHITSLDMIKNLDCEIPKEAEKLINKYWPGPLTMIFKKKAEDKKGIGFRMPKNEIAKKLIEKSSIPVVAPSANISGEKAPSTVEEVLKGLDGKVDLILNGGKTEIGVESTVIDLTESPFKVLREGAIPSEEIQKTLTE